MFDLGDLAMNHFQAERDDQRLVQFLHHSVKRHLTGGLIDRVDLERGGAFGSAHPEAVADLDFGGIFGESDTGR